jgi:hypothetical protein
MAEDDELVLACYAIEAAAAAGETEKETLVSG